jgi:hypothetical protein
MIPMTTGRPKTMDKRLPISFTLEQVRAIADTKYGLRLKTSSDAVRFLLDIGIESLRAMPAAERTRRAIKAGSELQPEDETGKRSPKK